ncbi:collagen alpha-1(XIV) chain isoform X2 [Esox lucius]|uniref:collagen alpha-1(XIV) chain isoform X2 n=1 Tax=Esox lucius TaxID=8010 RepID=UPI0006618AEC|nr:collagen alpha-1(XIV) chain isoform X2 [Esox lucius]
MSIGYIHHGKRQEKPDNMEGTPGLLAIFTLAACFLVSGAQRTECHTVADIVILVDGSTKIRPTEFQEVRMFLRTLIEGLDIGSEKVRVGLAQFSDQPKMEFLLADNTEKSSLLEKVDRLEQLKGGTATGTAIRFLQREFFNPAAGSRSGQRVPQIAVVLTDGDSVDDVVEPAKELRQHGVNVYAIGVGEININKLKAIANRPSKYFLNSIRSFQVLQPLSQGALQTVCDYGELEG